MSIKYIKSLEFFKNKDMEYSYDGLTRVINRKTTDEYINYLIENNIPFSLCLADVDNFKTINDSYGHLVGDKLLVTFIQKLCELVGEKTVIGRYGGDEFLIVVENCTEYDDIWQICHTISKNMNSTCYDFLDNKEITVTMGVARFPVDGKKYEELFNNVDKALYRGKSKGRSCFIIYLPEKHKEINLNADETTQMGLFSTIFDYLSDGEDLNENIDSLFEYLSKYFMFDHIAIEFENELFYSKVFYLSPVREFVPYGKKADEIFNSFGLFTCNQVSRLQEGNYDLYQFFNTNRIRSAMACKIESFGNDYGTIRIDMCGKGRIWQEFEMNVFITLARALGLILHYKSQTVKTLQE